MKELPQVSERKMNNNQTKDLLLIALGRFLNESVGKNNPNYGISWL
jgi:hypothetical protein